jgi:hypothetical protein
MEEARIFRVVDESLTKIKPLEGTYEIAYKYKENEEAVKVAEGAVNRGDAFSEEGKFPTVDPTKNFEYYEMKVTPTGPQGWDAYASKTKRVAALPPEGEFIKDKEQVELPRRDVSFTKEDLRKGLVDRGEKKYELLKQKYPTPNLEEE